MTKKVHLNSDVLEEARITAIHHGFRQLVKIFRSGGRDHISISPEEAKLIWKFTEFLELQAQLHFPGWSDSEPGYSEEDEYAFHEVNKGVFEALRSALDKDFPEITGRS